MDIATCAFMDPWKNNNKIIIISSNGGTFQAFQVDADAIFCGPERSTVDADADLKGSINRLEQEL